MPIRGLAPLILVLALGGPAPAEVKSAAPNGFEVVSVATIAALPDRVYAALGEVGRWSASHTFSRDAANLSIELRAGGCVCERLKDGGSVQHLQVVYAAPGEGLRLRGALGPLQMEGKPAEGGTSLTQSYVIGGYIRGGMEQWAPRVDRVLDEQLQRLRPIPDALGQHAARGLVHPVLRAPRGVLVSYSLPPFAIAAGRRALDIACASLVRRESRGVTS
jgi:hypothetical protein